MRILGGNTVGLDVGQAALRAAGLRRSGGAGRISWLAESGLPQGLILNSFTEPNITDKAKFVAALGGLFRSAGQRAGRVSVALPDYIARVSILDFDSLQGKKDETEQMIRWRLKKTLPFEMEQASMRYQYLGRLVAAGKEQHRFLVSVIKAEVLGQYEDAFREAGLKPARIEISSFSIWNLFGDYILRDAKGAGGFALMNVFGDKLTVMVFDRGMPHFLRIKDLGRSGTADEGDDAAQRERVLRELSASLTFYRENYQDTHVDRVYMAGDMAGLDAVAQETVKNFSLGAGRLDVEKVVAGEGPAGRPGEDLLAFSAACGAAWGA